MLHEKKTFGLCALTQTNNDVSVLTWMDSETPIGTIYEQMTRWKASKRTFCTDSWSDLLIWGARSAPSFINPQQPHEQLLFSRGMMCRSAVLLVNLINSRHQVRDREGSDGWWVSTWISQYAPLDVTCPKRVPLFCMILRSRSSNYWPGVNGRERSIAPNQRHCAPTPHSHPLNAIAFFLSFIGSSCSAPTVRSLSLISLSHISLICFLKTYQVTPTWNKLRTRKSATT